MSKTTSISYEAIASYQTEPIAIADSMMELYRKVENHPSPEFISIRVKTINYTPLSEFLENLNNVGQ